jgi:hypothetical protein
VNAVVGTLGNFWNDVMHASHSLKAVAASVSMVASDSNHFSQTETLTSFVILDVALVALCEVLLIYLPKPILIALFASSLKYLFVTFWVL